MNILLGVYMCGVEGNYVLILHAGRQCGYVRLPTGGWVGLDWIDVEVRMQAGEAAIGGAVRGQSEPCLSHLAYSRGIMPRVPA
jgi:hypothetical protein